MNYTEANEILGTRSSRKLANNTYLQRRDEKTIALRLHSTDVLIFTPQYVEYQTGGWYTVTTKQRMSNFGPAQIGSDKGKWLLYLVSETGYSDWQSGGYIFYDGIRVTNDGRKVIKPKTAPPSSDSSEMKKRINAYVAEAVKQLNAGLPMPSGGDCWGCHFRVNDDIPRAPVDSEPLGTGHLLSHFEESYVVPSLLWNAVKESGYRYPEVILGAHDNGNGYALGGMSTAAYDGKDRPRAMSDDVARALRRYLKRRLIPNETA
jgi:hypothetical protein